MQGAGTSQPNHSSELDQEGTPKQESSLPSALYIVATPIGNLGDITYRAVDTLSQVDLIACEDRRVTAKLLASYNIRTPSISYHDHNAARVRPKLIERLQRGESVALVSDAGTPLIADPGYKLSRACIAAGVAVVSIPGPNAAITALTVSGLPPEPFHFRGFLPSKTMARRRELEQVVAIDATLVFYESPHRLADCLRDLADVLGNRPAVVAREMTKLYEEVVRDGLEALAHHFAKAAAPKGEIVVVVGPPLAKTTPSDADVDALLYDALANASLRDAVDRVSALMGMPRRDVYARAVKLKSGGAERRD